MITALVGDQSASLFGQSCVTRGAKITFGTGAMLDMVRGPQGPDRMTRFAVRLFSDRHSKPATTRSSGESRASCSRPGRASSGSATTSVSITDRRRDRVPRPVGRLQPMGCRSCRLCRGSARRSGTSAPAAGSSGSRVDRRRPTSYAPYSRGSPTVAPTWSTPRAARPARRSKRSASTAA